MPLDGRQQKIAFALIGLLIVALLTWAVLATVINPGGGSRQAGGGGSSGAGASAASAGSGPSSGGGPGSSSSAWTAGARALVVPTKHDQREVIVPSCRTTDGLSGKHATRKLREIGLHPDHAADLATVVLAKGTGTRTVVVPACGSGRHTSGDVSASDAIAVYATSSAGQADARSSALRAILTVPKRSGADVIVVPRCAGSAQPAGGGKRRTLAAPKPRHGRDVLVVGTCGSPSGGSSS